MKPFQGVGWSCALVLLAASSGRVDAAWNNVYQVCCASCQQQPQQRVSAYVAFAPPATPVEPCNQCTTCTTRYVQRCYYQPVTTMRTSFYMEPVTTTRTSFFWEPVTTTRTSFFFDPCSCSWVSKSCPSTSYQLRSQSCPVQSFVQRSCQTPVTSYQQMSYYEPVTTCSTPPPCPPAPCPQPACTPTSAGVPAMPANPGMAGGPGVGESSTPSYSSPPPPPAGVGESRAPAAGVQEYRGTQPITGATAPAPQSNQAPMYDKYYNPQETMPPASYRQYPPRQSGQLRQPTPVVPAAPAPLRSPPTVRFDRIVSLPSGAVEGTIVTAERVPSSNVRLTFVSETSQGPRQTITADGAGQFRVALTSGNWLVYVHDQTGQTAFNTKIEVHDRQTQQLTLVSR